MSEGISNRWLLLFGGAGVVVLVVGLFVLMASDAPAGTPTGPVTPPVERSEARPPAAGDRPTIAAPNPPGESPAAKPPSTPPPSEPAIVHDNSNAPPDPAAAKYQVPPQVQNNVFKAVTPAVAACSPPRTSEMAGKNRGFASISYTLVIETGKAELEQVDAKADFLDAEHLGCIKKAFEGVGFDVAADQAPGRFPVTLQMAVP
jgi:hypothetical protein